jgi:hypothetical protein
MLRLAPLPVPETHCGMLFLLRGLSVFNLSIRKQNDPSSADGSTGRAKSTPH